MSTSAHNPVETFFQYIAGYWTSQCVYVAAVLGVADHLVSGSKSAEELAAITKSHPRTLYRVLRALAGLGIFAEDNGKFALTPVGEFLKSGPTGQRAMAIHLCEPNTWAAWGGLLHSVRTGEPAFKHVHGKEAFAFYADHPESFEPFNEAMTNFSMYAAASVTAAYDFREIRTLVDVGAGHGSLLGAILRANADLKGIAFDLPPVVEGAKSLAAEPGIAGRLSIAGGDFFEAVSSGDAHIMKSIIHDWDDDRAMKILRNIHRAQEPGGKLLLVEMIIGDGEGTALGKLSDLNMLVIPGGQERTIQEFGALFEKCGFKLNRVIPTESIMSVIEGIRV